MLNRMSTGVFIADGNSYRQAPAELAALSFVGCAEYMGYHPDQLLFYYQSKSQKITNIAFEIFTRNIVFLHTDKKVTFIDSRELKKAMEGFSVAKHYTSGDIMQILESGIENESLSAEFLAKVLNLANVANNGMFYSPKIKTYLYFTNGKLSNFQYDDGFSVRSKELKQVNRTIYDLLAKAAYKYRPNDEFGAQKEINIQSEAWATIPEAFGNEFIPFHRYDGGFVNFQMLKVTHYKYPMNRAEFMDLNYGRYQVITGNGIGDVILRLNRFDYRFNQGGDLVESLPSPSHYK